MENLVWVCMTCQENNPELFSDFSEEFIARRKEEPSNNDSRVMTAVEWDLDPVVLGQWTNAYAKAKYKDKEPFCSIAAAVVPIMVND